MNFKSLVSSAVFVAAASAQILPTDYKIERVAGGYQFTEGPVWSREGFLLFSETRGGVIYQIHPQQKPRAFRDPSNGANGNTYDAQGRLYTCEYKARRVTRTDKKGAVEVLADKFQGKRFNAPNDIVVRKDGHVYFTDPAFGPEQEKARELDYFGVYHITPKGEIEVIAKPKGRPNGVAMSPNGRILYVDNSDERNVRAYDLDKDGRASNERVVVANIDGSPDGMKVDEKGNLYVTANKLDIYSPEGKLLHQLEFGEMPRNIAFGDQDFQTLYITAITSVYRVRLDVKGSVQY